MDKPKWPIKYITKTMRVDEQTGEQITENKAKREYIRTITRKKIDYNPQRTKCYVEIVIQYRKQPQLNLFS